MSLGDSWADTVNRAVFLLLIVPYGLLRVIAIGLGMHIVSRVERLQAAAIAGGRRRPDRTRRKMREHAVGLALDFHDPAWSSCHVDPFTTDFTPLGDRSLTREAAVAAWIARSYAPLRVATLCGIALVLVVHFVTRA